MPHAQKTSRFSVIFILEEPFEPFPFDLTVDNALLLKIQGFQKVHLDFIPHCAANDLTGLVTNFKAIIDCVKRE